MGTVIDRIGQTFGKLIVLRQVDKEKPGTARWLCKCECGNEVVVIWGRKSCGCLQRELLIKRNTKHGATNTPEHKAYMGAKSRCINESHSSYNYYGGRGIEFRFKTFRQFLRCVGKRPTNTSLDRIDNNGHYEPGNVRWASKTTQNKNRRRWTSAKI